MKKRWNINSFLCEAADKDVTNIKRIFDTLRIKKNGSASFTIVTLLNALKSDESIFRLYYFIEQLSGGSRAYLGNTCFKKDEDAKRDSSGNKVLGSVEESVSVMLKAELEDIDFPESGQYELQVYKYDNEEAEDINNKTPEECESWAQKEHLVATYPFSVNISDD